MFRAALRRLGMNKQHAHHHHRLAASTVFDLEALYAANSGPVPARMLDEEPREIRMTLEARETAWAVSSDTTVSAWGYNGLVPGPILAGNVGDTLVVKLINRLA